ESPYRLPWPRGKTCFCVQGNRGVVSHRGTEQFAFDFAMPVGSPVCAARAGTVVHVTVAHHGRWFTAPNNLITIDHGDGTTAWYLPLQKAGSEGAAGERVEAGQVIGFSGTVGRSLLPHLHFEVADANGVSLPLAFADVGTHAGIPRMFRWYKSGN